MNTSPLSVAHGQSTKHGNEVNTPEYQFHTSFGEEFSGSSAGEIVEALYQNSKAGLGDIGFEDWWEYQRLVWKDKYDIELPDHSEASAHDDFLSFMVQIGALEKGVLPSETYDMEEPS